MIKFILKYNLSLYNILAIIWLSIQILIFYLIPYFVIPLLWFLIILFLFILIIRNIFLVFKNSRNLQFTERIIKIGFVFILFISTFFRFNYLPQRIIEKVDWLVLYNQRIKVIKKVKNNELKPNVSWNGFICELPFEFPIVSNGGNDIGIFYNEEKQYTVEFYVLRNFSEAPSIKIIYSENPDNIQYFESKIREDSNNNWKIKDNWYRIYGE